MLFGVSICGIVRQLHNDCYLECLVRHLKTPLNPILALACLLMLTAGGVHGQSKPQPLSASQLLSQESNNRQSNDGALGISTAKPSNEPLPVEVAFALSAKRQDGTVSIHFNIADAYYLYKEKISIAPRPQSQLEAVKLPMGLMKYDETFAKTLETYRNHLDLTGIKTSVLKAESMQIDVYSQGCADIGICYPPQLQRLTFLANQSNATVTSLDYVAPGTAVSGPIIPEQSNKAIITKSETIVSQQASGISQWLENSNPVWLVLGFIGFGLLLSFTPCVLPMMPIVSAIVLGNAHQSSTASGEATANMLQGFKLSLAYVLGMCVTYTAVGVLAGLAGAGFSAYLQHPVLLGFFATLMVVLAGAQFGWYSLSLPQTWMVKLSAEQNKIGSRRYGGTALMGALSAIMVGPCVTAPLAGTLTYIAQTGNAVTGGLALFSLAFGMGIPLLLIGAGGARWLPKTGAWMNQVTYGFGIMLLCVAIWTVQSLLPLWLTTALWVLILLLTAEMLGAFQLTSMKPTRLGRLGQGLAWACLVWGVAIVWGMAGGRFDVLQPLSFNTSQLNNRDSRPIFQLVPAAAFEKALSQSQGKPIMLDLYADWCVSCIEFERFTFTDPQVAQLMTQFTLLKVDVTRNTAEDRELLKKFKLFGPPAILFFSSQGQGIESAGVIGFQAAKPFATHLTQVLTSNR
jgi:thioredoxin:protein disulfide reductase